MGKEGKKMEGTLPLIHISGYMSQCHNDSTTNIVLCYYY